MSRGRFITFEGGEGCGKTTQLRLLADALRANGHTVVTTREPGGTPLAEQIRRILLLPGGTPPAPMTELLLFVAARAQVVHEVIAPALDRGAWVLADRFIDSTAVYQAHARGLSATLVELLNTEVAGAAVPDLTLVLDVPVDLGLARAHAQQEFPIAGDRDRIEQEARTFHEAVREGYHVVAAREPQRIRLIDGNRTIDEVQAACWEAVHALDMANTL